MNNKRFNSTLIKKEDLQGNFITLDNPQKVRSLDLRTDIYKNRKKLEECDADLSSESDSGEKKSWESIFSGKMGYTMEESKLMGLFQRKDSNRTTSKMQTKLSDSNLISKLGGSQYKFMPQNKQSTRTCLYENNSDGREQKIVVVLLRQRLNRCEEGLFFKFPS